MNRSWDARETSGVVIALGSLLGPWT